MIDWNCDMSLDQVSRRVDHNGNGNSSCIPWDLSILEDKPDLVTFVSGFFKTIDLNRVSHKSKDTALGKSQRNIHFK